MIRPLTHVLSNSAGIRSITIQKCKYVFIFSYRLNFIFVICFVASISGTLLQSLAVVAEDDEDGKC